MNVEVGGGGSAGDGGISIHMLRIVTTLDGGNGVTGVRVW